MGAGEEDGSGGVVIVSSIYPDEKQTETRSVRRQSSHLLPRALPCPKRLEENKDRRGVANWGLFLVSTALYHSQDLKVEIQDKGRAKKKKKYRTRQRTNL